MGKFTNKFHSTQNALLAISDVFLCILPRCPWGPIQSLLAMKITKVMYVWKLFLTQFDQWSIPNFNSFCFQVNSTKYILCHMSNVITYDIRIFTFVCLVRTISYHNWFVYVELYYLQLFTIIAYHLIAHIMLKQYVICNYIWHMRSQNYKLLILNGHFLDIFSV